MRKIYENAKQVVIWLGHDTIDQRRAKVAIEEMHRISDFLCKKLTIAIENLDECGDVYQEIIFNNRGKLPLPDEVEFTVDTTWDALVWFYSHPYFSRVWVIQEINANRERLLHCGNEKIIWNRVPLVAGYLMVMISTSRRPPSNYYRLHAATASNSHSPIVTTILTNPCREPYPALCPAVPCPVLPCLAMAKLSFTCPVYRPSPRNTISYLYLLPGTKTYLGQRERECGKIFMSMSMSMKTHHRPS